MARRNKLKDEWQFESEESSDKQNLSIELIKISPSQPRRYFDSEKLQQLTESVRQHGILEPILVRPLENGLYELVAGERRFRAAQEAALTSVPVTIRELTDEEALQLALVENLQREDLNPVEETEGILQLLALRLQTQSDQVPQLLYKMRNEAIGTVNQNVLINSQAEMVETVFSELGTISWESFTTTRLPLLKLPAEVLDALQNGKIAYTKAQAIARLKDDKARLRLLQDAIAQNLSLAQIKDRIKVLTPKEQKEVTVSDRLMAMSRKLKRGLSNPKRQRRIEKLLQELETLVEEEASGR